MLTDEELGRIAYVANLQNKANQPPSDEVLANRWRGVSAWLRQGFIEDAKAVAAAVRAEQETAASCNFRALLADLGLALGEANAARHTAETACTEQAEALADAESDFAVVERVGLEWMDRAECAEAKCAEQATALEALRDLLRQYAERDIALIEGYPARPESASGRIWYDRAVAARNALAPVSTSTSGAQAVAAAVRAEQEEEIAARAASGDGAAREERAASGDGAAREERAASGEGAGEAERAGNGEGAATEERAGCREGAG